MRTSIVTLSALLLASNLAWWLAWTPSQRTEPLAEPTTPVPATSERIVALEDALQRAQARVADLEAVAKAPARSPVRGRAAPSAPSATAEARQAAAQRSRQAHDQMKGWLENALQTKDAALRARTLDAVRQALTQGDPASMQAALLTLARLRELDYDKVAFRALVLPCVGSADGDVRAAALYALWNTAPEPSDLLLLLPLVNDPSAAVRANLTHVLTMYRKGVVDGEAADVVLRLLDDPDAEVRERARSSLWGANVDARIEDRYLAWLDDPRSRHDAIYFGLSTFAPKSPRVVQALLAAATDPNPEISGRARWGLTTGVGAESHAAVADAFVGLLESRADPALLKECLRLLRMYGSARHVPALETVLGRPALTTAFRAQLEQLTGELRGR